MQKEIFRNLTSDVTMTSLLKTMGNFDLRETIQIIYRLKGYDESFSENVVFEFLNQSYGHVSGISSSLVDFAMTSH